MIPQPAAALEEATPDADEGRTPVEETPTSDVSDVPEVNVDN